MCAVKNGTSANELRRTLTISYKSARFMCHRIREAMKEGPLAEILTGMDEGDEPMLAVGKSPSPALDRRK